MPVIAIYTSFVFSDRGLASGGTTGEIRVFNDGATLDNAQALMERL